ncbi:hypothetical protein [Amycolatopsis sp. 195334CR]|uniref:hypothetical protein n=1 Tax=Amycolatopsis sp. 195334CR TaxID=2814588 RepID=UPI001A8E0C7A|nr:hypothetical protein [Amycolatopsis sp. 195334CR]MBN6042135.1 hypothetical protein [Amycolatopsis sp. 195334CR]
MKNTLRRLAVAGTAVAAFASAGAVNAATAQAADYEFVNYYSTIDDCELTGRTGFANGDWTEWVCVYHTPLYFNWGLFAKF